MSDDTLNNNNNLPSESNDSDVSNESKEVFESWDSNKKDSSNSSTSVHAESSDRMNDNQASSGPYVEPNIPHPDYSQRNASHNSATHNASENIHPSGSEYSNSQNPYQQNPQFYPPQYNNYAGAPNYSPAIAEGNQHSTHSLIFGILSLLFAGLVFGPLAIWKASKAEKLGVSSTPGKVLGWIGLGFSILWIFWFALIIIGSFAGIASGGYMESSMYSNGVIES